mgnify:CR=1 FL=1
MDALLNDRVRAVEWRDNALRMLDQRRLPAQEVYLDLTTADEVAAAIRDMAVRGAPAIGIAAAYGTVLAAREAYASAGDDWREAVLPLLEGLGAARPTAVNLAWALERMRASFPAPGIDPEPTLLEQARTLHAEDVAANRAMAESGARYLGYGASVLTHCNTGALATGGIGTALGVIRAASASGRLAAVFACEARPWLQGSRLTAWELAKDGIPARVIADGAAAAVIREHGVAWVIVGADRIAANGDTANKIGTLGLALAARALGARTMVVAPTSTVDPACPTGASIPVELRDPEEVLGVFGHRVAAPGAVGLNPVFDVTPAEFIDVIVTERGVFENPADNPPGAALTSR